MRGRSAKQGGKEGMDIDKIHKLKEEPHLSGAYIRSLVKQLTSSRTKDPMNPKESDTTDGDGFSGQNIAKFSEGFGENQQTHQPQQHKKQVRRRLHTSRPYQERLLNMAEARREIVTALKFHRAAMKQANEQQQQQQPQQQSQPLQSSPQPSLEPEAKIKSRRNPRIYPSSTANFSSYLDSFSYSSFSSAPPNPYSWSASPSVPPPPPPTDNINFALPNQTLGLNLNFHDFSNLDATLYHTANNPSSVYSSSSPSSSSSPTLSIITDEVPCSATLQEGPPVVSRDSSVMTGGGFHPAMDDEEMAEIRWIGEQHQMEWNDNLNLATSAWWFKFLKTMEIGPEATNVEDDGCHPFDEVMDYPAWLNGNESCLVPRLDDFCPKDYLQDPALPW